MSRRGGDLSQAGGGGSESVVSDDPTSGPPPTLGPLIFQSVEMDFKQAALLEP